LEAALLPLNLVTELVLVGLVVLVTTAGVSDLHSSFLSNCLFMSLLQLVFLMF
jgi:hypothetical protein